MNVHVNPTKALRAEVQKLTDMGWQVVRLLPGGKLAFELGWPNLQRTASDFQRVDNIGLRFGPQSGGLVDIDLDYPTARGLIGRPVFGLDHLVEFGRFSLPEGQRGHRLVVCPDGPNKASVFAFRGKVSEALKARGLKLTVLELRAGNGSQSACPPSIINGDPLVWTNPVFEVPEMSWAELNRRAGILAFAAFAAAMYPTEGREEFCLGLYGALNDVVDSAAEIVAEVARLNGDDVSGVDMWLSVPPAAGLVGFLERVGMQVADRVVRPWLGLQAPVDPHEERSPYDEGESDTAPGGYDASRLKRILDHLDPRDYGSYYPFRDLMFAAHHMTNGDDDAREVFVEWTTRDPDYAVGKRDKNGKLWTEDVRGLWNRAKADRDGRAFTIGTLLRELIEHGHQDIAAEFINGDAADDFEDDLEPDPQRTARFAPVKYSDLLALPVPKWLVDHWLTEGGLFTVFGAEKMFKSFVVLDLCLCIATGRDWHGIKVKPGRVKYVIGEGNARRFADRITAWLLHNGVSQTEVDANFRVVPVRVGVDNGGELKAFFAADPTAYDLTVIDTVARNMDGDENATRDMNIMVKGADRIREVHGTGVVLVHHSGKDISRGARGSTALTGAVDAIIHVTKNTAMQSVVTLKNSRDAESGASLVFEPMSVTVSDPDDDEMRTSLVMRFVRMGDDADKKEAPSVTGDRATAVDKVLVALAEQGGAVNMQELVDDEEKGMSRANVQKAFRKLIHEKLVQGTGPYFCTAAGVERAMELGAVVPDKAAAK